MLGVQSAGHHEFRDHYRYSVSSIRMLTDRARALGVTDFLTTEKDAVRLERHSGEFDGFTVFFPCMRVEFLDGESDFFDRIFARIYR